MWEPVGDVKPPNGVFSALTIAAHGKRIFCGTTTGWVYVITTRDESLPIIRSRPVHAKGVNDITLTRGTKLVVTCSDDTTAVVLSGKKLVRKRTYKGALAPLRCCAVSPGTDVVCAGGDDMILYVWMTDQSDPTAFIAAHSAPITSVQFGGDGDQILSTSLDGLTRIWALYGQQLALLRTFMFNGHPALCARFLQNNNFFIVKYTSGDIILFEVASGSCMAQLKGEPKLDVPANFIHHLKSNGRVTIFSAGCDGKIRVWDLGNREHTLTIDASSGPGCVAVSASGRMLVYIGFCENYLRVFKA